MLRVGDWCPVCGVNRIKTRGAKTCSRPCGAMQMHARRTPEHRKRLAANMRAGCRRRFIDRKLEEFREELAPFRPYLSGPVWRELAVTMARVYRRGKFTGWQGCRAQVRRLAVSGRSA